AAKLEPEPIAEPILAPEPHLEPEHPADPAPEPAFEQPAAPVAAAPDSGLVLEPANEWAAAVVPTPAPAPAGFEAEPGYDPGPATDAPEDDAYYAPEPEPQAAPDPGYEQPAAALYAEPPAAAYSEPAPAPFAAAESSYAGGEAADEADQPFAVNLAELLVDHYYPVYRQRLNACPCPRCQDDACGMALNRIQPRYVVSTELNPEDLRQRTLVAETVTALVHAIFKVKRSPRHSA
ncbi:late competence development ComFB family protein, partial [Ruminococcaceae bacterium OttesenSCG-928-A11]|nr:late competence development ComFB family protein [Ruminococcaceae bacterium OttesenSCG-928-A11]